MIESRLFVVVRQADEGLTLTLTHLEPAFPDEGVVAAFRVPGAIAGETVLHFPSASVLPTA